MGELVTVVVSPEKAETAPKREQEWCTERWACCYCQIGSLLRKAKACDTSMERPVYEAHVGLVEEGRAGCV
jgi:hypothetical protein